MVGGVVAGVVYQQLKGRFKKTGIAISVAAICGSLTNTILVLGLIYLFYKGNAPQLYQVNVKALLPYLLGGLLGPTECQKLFLAEL